MFTPVEEMMRALDDQVRAGKVLYIGVSDWPAWEIARATTLAEERGWTPFAGMELPYSLLERSPERELIPMAQALDIAVAAFSPLASGLLTGKYLADAGDGPARAGRIAGSARPGAWTSAPSGSSARSSRSPPSSARRRRRSRSRGSARVRAS